MKGRKTGANGGLNWEVQSKGGFLVIALRITQVRTVSEAAVPQPG